MIDPEFTNLDPTVSWGMPFARLAPHSFLVLEEQVIGKYLDVSGGVLQVIPSTVMVGPKFPRPRSPVADPFEARQVSAVVGTGGKA